MTDSRIVDRQLSLARQGLAPSAALRARVRAEIATSSPATGGGTTEGRAARGVVTAGLTQAARTPRGWVSLRESGKTGIVVGVALLALGFGGGYLARSRDVEPAPPLPTRGLSAVEAVTLDVNLEEPAEAIAHEGARAIVSAPEPAPAAAREAAARSHHSRSVRTATPSARGRGSARPQPQVGALQTAAASGLSSAPALELAAEPAAQSSDQLTLLRRAERAVRAENPSLAIALVSEHAERYPHSALVEERQAIELMAHCEAGAVDASERARLFLQGHPKSVYASRVRELCWVEPTIDRAGR